MLLFTLGASAAALLTRWALVALVCVLIVDFIVFVFRRLSLLDEFARGTPRIVTAAQASAVDKVFAETGAALPSMTDWERAAGLGEAPPWKTALRYRELLRLGKPVADSTFLDVGCGDGRLGWRYGVAGRVRRYIGLDVGFDLVRELKGRLPKSDAIQAGADSLPITSGGVDFIACTEAFEHFAEPGDVLQEFARCLAPKGRVVIQSPSALRIRNVNPFHILQCVIGTWFPWVLQPYANQSGLIIQKVHCATYRFNPDGTFLHRAACFATRHVWPLTLLGWDMTVVLDKEEA